MYSRIFAEYKRLTKIIVSDVFMVRELYNEQVEVLVKVAMMKFLDVTHVPALILFVKTTWGIKSLVRDV